MIKTRHILFILLPAILIVAFALFVRALQYEPLQPKKTEEKETVEPKTAKLQIPISPDDPIMGGKKAPITLIAFEDLACGHCAEQDAIFKELLAKHPNKIKIIWKPLPVIFLPYPSGTAHKYAFCANKQNKFEEFKTIAFSNQMELSPNILSAIAEQINLNPEILQSCLESGEVASYLETTKQLGIALNIQSVPAIFFNNVQIENQTTVTGWKTLLQL
ncbi:MAG: DsbA family protein [Patescibacteria group bacterium]